MLVGSGAASPVGKDSPFHHPAQHSNRKRDFHGTENNKLRCPLAALGLGRTILQGGESLCMMQPPMTAHLKSSLHTRRVLSKIPKGCSSREGTHLLVRRVSSTIWWQLHVILTIEIFVYHLQFLPGLPRFFLTLFAHLQSQTVILLASDPCCLLPVHSQVLRHCSLYMTTAMQTWI